MNDFKEKDGGRYKVRTCDPFDVNEVDCSQPVAIVDDGYLLNDHFNHDVPFAFSFTGSIEPKEHFVALPEFASLFSTQLSASVEKRGAVA